ncbi:MAG TPA: hypothetical protein EYP56_15870, partial [Planctomycetaceae bacterium]|nr:hypothetical protein [Planctomycetaceae bacterium]
MRTLKLIAVVALVVWGGFGWWQVYWARRAAGAMAAALADSWPVEGGPRPGTRAWLLEAGRQIERGRFGRAFVELTEPGRLDRERRMRAQRFLARAAQLRQRLIDAASSAQALEADGVDAGVTRGVFQRDVSLRTFQVLDV